MVATVTALVTVGSSGISANAHGQTCIDRGYLLKSSRLRRSADLLPKVCGLSLSPLIHAVHERCTNTKPKSRRPWEAGLRYGSLDRCARSASGSSSEEVPLNWSKWVRQIHRWLSIAFTVAVIVNIVAVVLGKYTRSIGLLAVFPLVLQLFTGLYLFVLPYGTKWRSGRRTG